MSFAFHRLQSWQQYSSRGMTRDLKSKLKSYINISSHLARSSRYLNRLPLFVRIIKYFHNAFETAQSTIKIPNCSWLPPATYFGSLNGMSNCIPSTVSGAASSLREHEHMTDLTHKQFYNCYGTLN